MLAAASLEGLLNIVNIETAVYGGSFPGSGLISYLSLHCGTVVDPQLRVAGVARLRVADPSVMPNLVSGNINTVCIMIGEKAAEMIAFDHGVRIAEFVARLPVAQ